MKIKYNFAGLAPTLSAPTALTIQERFQQGLALHQQGKLDAARSIYEWVLKVDTKHADALHLLGVIAFQTRDFAGAINSINQAIVISANNAAFYLNRGNAEMELGRLEAAVLSYGQAISIQPAFVEAYFNRGLALSRQGKCTDSIVDFDRVIKLKPDYAEAYSDRGMSLIQLKDYKAAIKSFDEAIAVKPDFSNAFLNRGIALQALNQLEDSIESYNRAIALAPQSAEAYLNRGVALKELGKIDEAISSYDRAIAVKSDYAKAYFNRGIAFEELHRLEDAVAAFRRVIAIDPGFVEAHTNLGSLFKEQGNLDEAIPCYFQALRLQETDAAKSGFANCLQAIAFTSANPEDRRLVARAISQAWIRPEDLLTPTLSLLSLSPTIGGCIHRVGNAWPKRLSKADLFLQSDLATIADDELLCCALSTFTLADVHFELFLTSMRHVILHMASEQDRSGQAGSPEAEDGKVLNLLCCLARQCFINEYVFDTTDEEQIVVASLRESLALRLASKAPIPALLLVAVASYASLSSLPRTDGLLEQPWPEPVQVLLKQQILEPKAEYAYRSQIQQLTPIDSGVSSLVQRQYEENPYPRWIKAATTIRAVPFDAYLRAQFPLAPIETKAHRDSFDILVAGSGTGQHPTETAQEFIGANVLAIDLSLSSLCYAKRKTDELALTNLRYAHADISRLGALSQRFDLIESVGVLHHMADPVAGWKVLVGLLNPRGFMRLGFYSELARQDVVAAREYIAAQGYDASPANIRRCRRELIHENTTTGRYSSVLSSRDFYGTSDCRDLLFHVQEHRYTIPQLKQILDDLSLQFIGFSVRQDTAIRYAARFPDDPSRCNLDNWHVFETEFPDTFAAMYQFWVQRIE